MARKTTLGTRAQLAAPVADLGSVFRPGFDYSNPFSYCFILDEELQLIEAPVAYPIIHSPSSICFSYSFEVFHYDFVSFEFGNNIFADVMVGPLHPTSFSSSQLFEKPFAGTSAFSLKLGAQMLEFSLDLFDFGGVIKTAVGSYGKVVYSEVNAKNSILRSVAYGINLFRECEQEEASSFLVHSEEAFFNIPREIFLITGGNVKLELLPFLEEPQDKSVSFEIGASWEVISYRCPVDYRLGLSFFNHSAGLLDTGNSKLRRKCFPQMLINKWVELDIIPDFSFPCLVNAELQPLFIRFNCSNYLRGSRNLDFSSYNTPHSNCKDLQVYNLFGGEWANRNKLRGIKPKAE